MSSRSSTQTGNLIDKYIIWKWEMLQHPFSHMANRNASKPDLCHLQQLDQVRKKTSQKRDSSYVEVMAQSAPWLLIWNKID